MRLAGLALIVAMGLVPSALSEAGDEPSIAVAPFGRDLAPLREWAETTFVAEISCSLALGAPAHVDVEFFVHAAPDWVLATLDPSELRIALEECSGGSRRVEGTLRAAVETNAPAFRTSEFGVRLRAHSPQGLREAEARVEIRPGWYGALEGPESSEMSLRIGEERPFVMRFQNLGNGPIRVSPHLPPPQRDVDVEIERSIVIESLATGATDRNDLVAILKWTGPEGPARRLTLEWTSSYAHDPSLVGPSGNVSLLLHPEAVPLPVPHPGAIGAIVVAALVACWGRPS